MSARWRRWLGLLSDVHRARAVDTLEWEVQELRQIFALLLLGHGIGLPAPPAELTLSLLPDLEEELHMLITHIDTAQSPLSQLFSSLPVD
ncbi:MAG: hypothetical protein IH600_09440 [Bacteroidetes bacterium]|nr:hypothetical protein [Bacteroidota bacterium]